MCYNTLMMGRDSPKNYKWMLLALLSATYFLAQGSRQVFNAVLPQIKADFAGAGITDAQLGLVGSAFTLVFGLALAAFAPSAVLGWMNSHFSMSSGMASLSAFALAGAAAIWVARAFFFERDKT